VILLPLAPVLVLAFAVRGAPDGAGGAARSACESPADWPLWQRYAEVFIRDDGRVVEPSAGNRTTSEGQAYGVFFALVANDRPRFDRLLAWTENNLAKGDLTRNLPGWHWGRDDAGQWRLLDDASAADADLWLAYSLLEAGRLWRAEPLSKQGRSLLARAVAREVVRLPGLGFTLLPGPVGFEVSGKGLWRLNPSYLPLQLLRRFASSTLPGPWGELPATTLRLVRARSRRGFVPDWVGFDRKRGFVADPVAGNVGSYDAIRVYLWAGMLAREEPLRAPLFAAIAGPIRSLREQGRVPEKVDTQTGDDRGERAPPGFLAALLPNAVALGASGAASHLRAALADELKGGLYGAEPTYYDQNLALFGLGFDEGRFQFDASGALGTQWETRCHVQLP
jgi:endo-1,4-beta-D-glucanase Y